MKKIKLIFVALMLLLTLISFAYAVEPNTIVRIDAKYIIDGIYQDSDAKISILAPNLTELISDEEMIQYATGRFYYDYLTPETLGDYDVTIDYYNKTDSSLLSSDTKVLSLEVEQVSELSFNNIFYPALIIVLIFLISGFIFGQPIVGIIGGLSLVVLSLTMLTSYFMGFGVIAGLVLSLVYLFKEN